MALARVQNFSISLDGFATGDGVGPDAPFGHAGDRLHAWQLATRWGRDRLGQPGGTGGVDDAFAKTFGARIGAEIMGAGKFGPPGWQEDFIDASPAEALETARDASAGQDVRIGGGPEVTSSPSGVAHLTFTRTRGS